MQKGGEHGKEVERTMEGIYTTGEFRGPLAVHTDAGISLASGLDSEGYPRLATLAGNAPSIRLFHLRSTGASEGE